MTGEANGLRERLDRAIREHRLTGFDAWMCSCTCGDQLEEGDYYSHLTTALLPLFERVQAEARTEAARQRRRDDFREHMTPILGAEAVEHALRDECGHEYTVLGKVHVCTLTPGHGNHGDKTSVWADNPYRSERAGGAGC